MGDGGFRTLAYWQTTKNWKNRRFRNLPMSNYFHRVTRCQDQ